MSVYVNQTVIAFSDDNFATFSKSDLLGDVLNRIISGEILNTFGIVCVVKTEAIGDIVNGEGVPSGVISNPATILYWLIYNKLGFQSYLICAL